MLNMIQKPDTYRLTPLEATLKILYTQTNTADPTLLCKTYQYKHISCFKLHF